MMSSTMPSANIPARRRRPSSGRREPRSRASSGRARDLPSALALPGVTAFAGGGAPDLHRIGAHGFGNVLEMVRRPRINDREPKPRLHLPIGVLR